MMNKQSGLLKEYEFVKYMWILETQPIKHEFKALGHGLLSGKRII